MVKLNPGGLNYINILRTAFKRVDPESVKRYWWLNWVFMLWGATGVKAARKYVDEIDDPCGSRFIIVHKRISFWRMSQKRFVKIQFFDGNFKTCSKFEEKNCQYFKIHARVNFINILHTPFLYESALRSFSLLTIFWQKNIIRKAVLKILAPWWRCGKVKLDTTES